VIATLASLRACTVRELEARTARGAEGSAAHTHGFAVKGERTMGSDKHAFVHAVHAVAVPHPYQLAIENAAFDLTVLSDGAARSHDPDIEIAPPAWFSVVLCAPCAKHYLYLVQKEVTTGLIVVILLFDRSATGDDSRRPRLPPSGAWLRAVVDGTVHVLASDLVLSRKAITAWIGGREPPTMPAQPPYT